MDGTLTLEVSKTPSFLRFQIVNMKPMLKKSTNSTAGTHSNEGKKQKLNCTCYLTNQIRLMYRQLILKTVITKIFKT